MPESPDPLGSRTFLTNTAYGLLDNAVAQAANLGISILLGRFLGAATLGDYAGLLALSGIIGGLAGFGIQGVVGREVARDTARTRLYLGHALAIRLALSIPLTVLFTGLFSLAFLELETVSQVFAPVVACYAGCLGLLTLLNHVFINIHAVREWLVRHSAYKLIALGLTLVLLLAGQHLLAIVLVWMALAGVTVLLVCRQLRRITGPFPLRMRWRFTKTLILKSLPLSMGGLAEFINLRADTLLLLVLINSATAGLYSVATQMYLVASMVPMTFIKVYSPVFIKELHRSRASAFRQLSRATLGFAALALACALAVAMIASELIWYTYGERFADAATMLGILSCALVPLAINRLFIYALIACKMNVYYAKVSWAAALFNVAANLVCIPRFGWMGAAGTTITTETLVLALLGLKLWSLARQ